MAAVGGYQQSPVSADTDLSQLQHGSWVTLQAFLELFGANILNLALLLRHHDAVLEVASWWLHLAGALAGRHGGRSSAWCGSSGPSAT